MRARWFGLGAAALLSLSAFACGLDDSVELENGNGSTSGGGDGGNGTDATISTDGGAIDGSTPTGDGGTTPDTGSPTPPVLIVYATTETEFYSYDVISGKLTDIGALTNCGSPTNLADLAIDSSGNLFMLKASDAIYALDRTGNCSTRMVPTVDNGGLDKIAGRINGTPGVVVINLSNDDYYAIDPPTGTVTKINPDLFPNVGQTGLYDFACAKTGSCWTALASGCNPGLGSCLYTFPDDGGSVAQGLGAIGVLPAGLVYALGSLYSFGVNGQITQIDLSATPLVAKVVTTNGAALPTAWTGAASSPND